MSRRTVGKVCPECPFRKGSAPGYLGAASFDPQGFVMPHWAGEQPLPCHMTVDWEGVPEQAKAMSVQRAPGCRGLVACMAKSAKLPRDPELAGAVQMVTAVDKDEVMNLGEFMEHHKKGAG